MDEAKNAGATTTTEEEIAATTTAANAPAKIRRGSKEKASPKGRGAAPVATGRKARIGRARFADSADAKKIASVLGAAGYFVVATVGGGETGSGRKDGFNYALSLYRK